MGQWLKAIGGYTVEQIGTLLSPPPWHSSPLSPLIVFLILKCRLLPIGNDRFRHRFNARLCHLDGPYPRSLARTRLHVGCVHYIRGLYPCVEQPHWAQVFCVLYAMFGSLTHLTDEATIYQIWQAHRTRARLLLSRSSDLAQFARH